jgi:hypothetical protein
MTCLQSPNGSVPALERCSSLLILPGLLLLSSSAAAVEMTAGDWKFSASGNVNVHYIHASCEDQTTHPV